MLVEKPLHLSQVRRGWEQVRVAEHDESTAALANPSVECAWDASLEPHLDDGDFRVVSALTDCVAHVLQWIVVHDDNLDIVGRVAEKHGQ